MRVVVRVLLCVAGLAGGVGLAHVTRDAEQPTTTTSTTTTTAVVAETREVVVDGPAPEPVVEVAEVASDGMAEGMKDGLLITGATRHRMILFTFDDGPDWRQTPRLLEMLDEEGIKAVFFLTASRITGTTPRTRAQAEIAREALRRGHVIASHGFDHVHFTRLDHPETIRQVDAAAAAIERAVGARPWLIRPPFGARSPRVDNLLADRGYTTMMWNLGGGDHQVRTADAVYETWRRVMDRVEREGSPGGVMLLHDIHPWSVDAFPRIVADLKARNCDLLERNEELFDIVDDPTLFFAPRGDALPGTAAPPAAPAPELVASRQARVRAETTARCRTVAAR